ncbi:hypothetical protein QJ856_gp0518 [Tupanvirus deep ocean]|uniref:Uncharacterized protein n=2 Tax=Tupanvirus TaxID=2094720 RepID=A0AC62A9A8_9VIRU|nr:hypothetical protein QJ856_gp0518 [Tupanvirus deep ocean]QKU34228.1 hypothetical protein [Tupanvirus deep ocean]
MFSNLVYIIMSDNLLTKALIIFVYLVIIIMIPLFLDYLFKLTVRKNRKNKILALAKNKSLETGKPIIIFNNANNGVVINKDGTMEEFNGDIIEIINQMADNTCVMIVSESLEYIGNNESDNNDKIIIETINQLNAITGGDVYFVNIEKNSPRVFWDYNIKNVMDKSFYLPGDNLSWSKPNDLQKKVQKLYFHVFKILPYNFFAYDPIVKV